MMTFRIKGEIYYKGRQPFFLWKNFIELELDSEHRNYKLKKFIHDTLLKFTVKILVKRGNLATINPFS